MHGGTLPIIFERKKVAILQREKQVSYLCILFNFSDITLESFEDWVLQIGGVYIHNRDIAGRRICELFHNLYSPTDQYIGTKGCLK